MNAFTDAAAALHADVNRSVVLDYKPRDAPMVRGIRGIRLSPTETMPGFGRSGVGALAKREQISLPVASLAQRPQRGDEIQIIEARQDPRDVLAVETCEDSSEGASWLITLTRASLPRD